MFMELIGAPPRSLLERAERRKKFFNDDFVCKIPPPNKRDKRETLSWKAILGSNCDIGFLDLVKRCLEWSPETRITPREALLHEWIVAGLPHNIRAQHIEQLQER
jgi:dual specificity tyrosine-phosphorylation-regulated kinase 2/3/4